MNIKPIVKTYKLGGGSKVSVYKIFGKRFYFAIVEMDGHYPKEGEVAHNIGRNEFVVVLDGKIKVVKNGKQIVLSEGKTILFENGSRYEISGKGKSLVFVDDGVSAKGESRIEVKE